MGFRWLKGGIQVRLNSIECLLTYSASPTLDGQIGYLLIGNCYSDWIGHAKLSGIAEIVHGRIIEGSID